MTPEPIILHCPNCGKQHLDILEGDKDWSKIPHKTHLCKNTPEGPDTGCGYLWRPKETPTVGVVSLDCLQDHTRGLSMSTQDRLADISKKLPHTEVRHVGGKEKDETTQYFNLEPFTPWQTEQLLPHCVSILEVTVTKPDGNHFKFCVLGANFSEKETIEQIAEAEALQFLQIMDE